jgi:hypothetical protein
LDRVQGAPGVGVHPPPRAQSARRSEVSETAVSRDERNEYHGITVDRARKALDALGVRLVTRVEVEPMRAMPRVRGKPGPGEKGSPKSPR